MTDEELRAARDHVWDALATAPLRRAALGRERCDAIVRVALNQLPTVTHELTASGRDASAGVLVQRRLERRVRSLYSENCGMALMTLVIAWAISAIVQALVIRWLNKEPQT